MAMRSRIPALLALALALCALPGVRAFASAICPPCCPEHAAPVLGPDCAPQASDCCEVVPAAPAAAPEHTNSQPPAPALVTTPRTVTPVPAALLAPQPAGQIVAARSSSRLSVVRLL